MSGNASIRGYLVQTIISLLESLKEENDWQNLRIEPVVNSNKVDLIFNYADTIKAIQIKSSQNQIGLAQVKLWAEELENSFEADSYEVILIGPTAQSVIDIKLHGNVKIPSPKVLDITALIEQAAHRIDVYLHEKGYASIPPFIREEFISSLITKLENYSTSGDPLSRDDFDMLLNKWIMAIYPSAINNSIEMQCDILIDTIVIPAAGSYIKDDLLIMLPIQFINDGIRTSIIEWVALKVKNGESTKLYTPISFIDYIRFVRGKKIIHGDNVISHFHEFAVMNQGHVSLTILFSQEENNINYKHSLWHPGKYKFEIFVKYRDKETAVMQKELEMTIEPKILEDFNSGNSSATSIRNIDI
jgi:hypothetical protein